LSAKLRGLFPPTQDSLEIALAITERRASGRNYSPSEIPGDTRYLSETRKINDETTGSDPRSVQIRRKNIRLILQTEASEGIVLLPLARIRRDGKGHFLFDPDFIPPCLQISCAV